MDNASTSSCKVLLFKNFGYVIDNPAFPYGWLLSLVSSQITFLRPPLATRQFVSKAICWSSSGAEAPLLDQRSLVET
jgi:hypothetical protein